jgi:hypothetical protein
MILCHGSRVEREQKGEFHVIETQDWQEEAVRLRREEKMATAEIAERVGRSASRVRRVIAEAQTDRAINGSESNGNGPYTMRDGERVPVDVTAPLNERHYPPEHYATTSNSGGDATITAGGFNGPPEEPQGDIEAAPPLDESSLAHQTTVEEQIEQTNRILWTGENRQEVAYFLGRGENGTIVASNIDLPTATEGEMARARPGDTIVKLGDGTYMVEGLDEDPLAAFKREAGDAVGDMPPTDPPADPEYESRLKGTRQMALDFGADELPVGGTIKFKSDKLASGFYGLGDVVTGTFTARVVDVAGAERFQRASEEFRIQPQGHVALITEITVGPGE